MQNISFALTINQYRAQTKTVTRRDAWRSLKPGDKFMGVEKAMGLQRGEKIVKIEPSIVLSLREEPLRAITQLDVTKEGFPAWTPQQFIEFFCKDSGCTPEKILNRIEFEYEAIYRRAVEIVKKVDSVNITLLQRWLRIDGGRWKLIIDEMKREGIVC